MSDIEKIKAERDAYKAVLIGAEYEGIDEIGEMDPISAGLIGVGVANATKGIIKESDNVEQCARNLLTFFSENCGDSERSIVEIKCNGEDSDIYAAHVAGLLSDLEKAINGA